MVAGAGITRTYGSGDTAVHALQGVSVEVTSGKLTAVMGPSGSGKSTLMHILAGLDKPTEGDVWISGTALGELNDTQLTKLRREHIGFIFQFFNLLPMLTREGEHRPAALDRRREGRPGLARAADDDRRPRRIGSRTGPRSSPAASSSGSRSPGRSSRSRR